MDWEYIDEYAWETLGQVRFTPLRERDKITGDGTAYDAPPRQRQTDKSWTGSEVVR